MSRAIRIALVGGSGLVGSALIHACVGRNDVRLTAIARNELQLPRGARMEVLLADPERWGDAIAAARPDTVVCALGTTWRKAGQDEAAFRAVDHDLVLDCARWALEAGARQFITVSAAGANSGGKALYMRVKGETEAALSRLRFERLDILQPGLLRGAREEWRLAERIGQAVAPVIDPLLGGGLRRYRSISAGTVAEAILALAHEKARGRFVHDYDGMQRAIRRRNYERSLGRAEEVVD